MSRILRHRGGGLWEISDGQKCHLTLADSSGREYCDCGQFAKGKGTHSGCVHLDILLAKGKYASRPSSSSAWDSRAHKWNRSRRHIQVHPYWYGIGREGVDGRQQGRVKQTIRFSEDWTANLETQTWAIPVWAPD